MTLFLFKFKNLNTLSCSDHIALLKAFEGWKEEKCKGNDKAFCWDSFLSPITLRMMDDMRLQFLDLLSDIGFVDKSREPSVSSYLLCNFIE